MPLVRCLLASLAHPVHGLQPRDEELGHHLVARPPICTARLGRAGRGLRRGVAQRCRRLRGAGGPHHAAPAHSTWPSTAGQRRAPHALGCTHWGAPAASRRAGGQRSGQDMPTGQGASSIELTRQPSPPRPLRLPRGAGEGAVTEACKRTAHPVKVPHEALDGVVLGRRPPAALHAARLVHLEARHTWGSTTATRRAHTHTRKVARRLKAGARKRQTRSSASWARAPARMSWKAAALVLSSGRR